MPSRSHMFPPRRPIELNSIAPQAAPIGAGGLAPARPARRPGFTLIEMMVVIAIMIIIILIAVPAIRGLTGTRSIAAAENTLSALITRAREEAVGIQDYRGVLFYLDPNDDTMKGMLVMNVAPTTTDNGLANPPVVWLDAEADHDRMSLPGGIGIQTAIGVGPVVTGGVAQPRTTDTYLGFNPLPTAAGSAFKFGGVILFDGSGKLVSTTYGFRFTNSDSTASNLAKAFNLSALTADFAPALSSQFGFVLYDREAFNNAGGTDGDPGFDTNVSGYPGAELNEETWLDQNSTPILINRYTGTLIRAE